MWALSVGWLTTHAVWHASAPHANGRPCDLVQCPHPGRSSCRCYTSPILFFFFSRGSRSSTISSKEKSPVLRLKELPHESRLDARDQADISFSWGVIAVATQAYARSSARCAHSSTAHLQRPPVDVTRLVSNLLPARNKTSRESTCGEICISVSYRWET